MPRLLRPSIPLEVQCRVVLHQLGEMFIDQMLDAYRYDMTVAPSYRGKGFKHLLAIRLPALAELLGCERSDLRLDHNPALGLRTKIINRLGEHVGYEPDANDPEYLIYRTKHDHHLKTNVRGDGAQFSDTALMKRERKRKLKAAGKKKRSRPIPQRKDPWNKQSRKPSLWPKRTIFNGRRP